MPRRTTLPPPVRPHRRGLLAAASRYATAARPVPNPKSVAQKSAQPARAARAKASNVAIFTAAALAACLAAALDAQMHSHPTVPRARSWGLQMQVNPDTSPRLHRPRHATAPAPLRQTMAWPATPIPTITAQTRSRHTPPPPMFWPPTCFPPSPSTPPTPRMAPGTTAWIRSPASMPLRIPISWTGTPPPRPCQQICPSTRPWVWVCSTASAPARAPAALSRPPAVCSHLMS